MGLRADVAKVLAAAVMSCEDLRENDRDHEYLIDAWADARKDALENGFTYRADLYTMLIGALEECQAMLFCRHASAIKVYLKIEEYYKGL